MVFLSHNPFLSIINGDITAETLYSDDDVIAFRDIHPQAKTHILICPKHPYVTAKEVTEDNQMLFGKLFLVAKQLAETENLEGYKLHMNVGEKGGQVVPHVHLHLLSSDYKSSL